MCNDYDEHTAKWEEKDDILLLRSLVRSLAHFAHSLARGTVNVWMAILSAFFSIFDYSATVIMILTLALALVSIFICVIKSIVISLMIVGIIACVTGSSIIGVIAWFNPFWLPYYTFFLEEHPFFRRAWMFLFFWGFQPHMFLSMFLNILVLIYMFI